MEGGATDHRSRRTGKGNNHQGHVGRLARQFVLQKLWEEENNNFGTGDAATNLKGVIKEISEDAQRPWTKATHNKVRKTLQRTCYKKIRESSATRQGTGIVRNSGGGIARTSTAPEASAP